MIPIKFTIESDGATYFHYDPEDLKRFHERGELYGDVGMILERRYNNLLSFSMYGTIEHPCKVLNKMYLIHHPLFDGEMPTDEQRCNPPSKVFNPNEHKFIFIDFSE